MTIRKTFFAASAMLALGTTAICAQPIYPPPGNDPDGYYSRNDDNGYYDRDGHYRHIRHDRDYREDGPPPGGYNNSPPPPGGYENGPPPPPPGYYQQGAYESNCHRGDAAAGTIFGAIAGGVLGGAVSHGNGGAVVGGAVLGGLLGNTVSRDIDCDDQPEAFRVYATGLNGDIGRRYEWHHGNANGYFIPTREFRRDGYVCREFTETSYRGGQAMTRTGSACRHPDGNWRFD